MPSPVLQVRIPQDLADWLEEYYPARGDVSKLVRELLDSVRLGGAPTESPSSNVIGSIGEVLASIEQRPDGTVMPVEVPDQPVSVMDSGRDLAMTQESPLVVKGKPDIAAAKAGSPSLSLAEKPAQRTIQHCNRGACTGVIKPNGRCIRCNQIPLKEAE
jgi:hypothetical protein